MVLAGAGALIAGLMLLRTNREAPEPQGIIHAPDQALVERMHQAIANFDRALDDLRAAVGAIPNVGRLAEWRRQVDQQIAEYAGVERPTLASEEAVRYFANHAKRMDELAQDLRQSVASGSASARAHGELLVIDAQHVARDVLPFVNDRAVEAYFDVINVLRMQFTAGDPAAAALAVAEASKRFTAEATLRPEWQLVRGLAPRIQEQYTPFASVFGAAMMRLLDSAYVKSTYFRAERQASSGGLYLGDQEMKQMRQAWYRLRDTFLGALRGGHEGHAAIALGEARRELERMNRG